MSDDKKDEARARALHEKLTKYYRGEAGDIDLIRCAFQEVRAERDAELQRAMVVVEAAVALPLCMLCDPEDGPIENEMSAHTETCPLVSQGFITTTGERR